jgi:hypothetical protein
VVGGRNVKRGVDPREGVEIRSREKLWRENPKGVTGMEQAREV